MDAKVLSMIKFSGVIAEEGGIPTVKPSATHMQKQLFLHALDTSGLDSNEFLKQYGDKFPHRVSPKSLKKWIWQNEHPEEMKLDMYGEFIESDSEDETETIPETHSTTKGRKLKYPKATQAAEEILKKTDSKLLTRPFISETFEKSIKKYADENAAFMADEGSKGIGIGVIEGIKRRVLGKKPTPRRKPGDPPAIRGGLTRGGVPPQGWDRRKREMELEIQRVTKERLRDRRRTAMSSILAQNAPTPPTSQPDKAVIVIDKEDTSDEPPAKKRKTETSNSGEMSTAECAEKLKKRVEILTINEKSLFKTPEERQKFKEWVKSTPIVLRILEQK